VSGAHQRRLLEDLDRIRRRVAAVGARIDDALGMAVHALMTGDRGLAAETVLNDFPINRTVRELDAECHRFVARHLPSAGHLRFVSSVLRLNIALERIGDYAVTIARETEQLGSPPPEPLASTMQAMADQSRKMYRQAISSWVDQNAELARGTKAMASSVDVQLDGAWRELLRMGQEPGAPSMRRMFAYLIVCSNLERVSDQAKNICEEAVFAATGQTKPPKRYKVLFLDERNDRLSVLAEAMAQKAFPDSGVYTSAGWSAVDQVDSELAAFLDERGMAPGEHVPRSLSSLMHELPSQHIVVSLAGDPRPHLGQVPFSTVVLEWSIPGDLAGATEQLADKIAWLMEKCRGEGAS
jgi:phosphate transport system protein